MKNNKFQLLIDNITYEANYDLKCYICGRSPTVRINSSSEMLETGSCRVCWWDKVNKLIKKKENRPKSLIKWKTSR